MDLYEIVVRMELLRFTYGNPCLATKQLTKGEAQDQWAALRIELEFSSDRQKSQQIERKPLDSPK